jgi:hypothetical protein
MVQGLLCFLAGSSLYGLTLFLFRDQITSRRRRSRPTVPFVGPDEFKLDANIVFLREGRNQRKSLSH